MRTTEEALLAVTVQAEAKMEAIIADLMSEAEGKHEGVGAFVVASALVGAALDVMKRVDGPKGRVLFIDHLITALREGRDEHTVQ